MYRRIIHKNDGSFVKKVETVTTDTRKQGEAAGRELIDNEIFLAYILIGVKMQRDSYDKRRHKRHLYFHKIEYCLGSCSPDDICHGSIINISESGMCMYTVRRLEEGEDIEIMNSLPVPYQKATTRWVVKYFQDLYKIGLEFIDHYAIPLSGGGDLNLSERN